MTITINGGMRDVGSATVADLLRELELTERLVAVEVNREVVRRAAFQTCALHEGDVLEIVSFVGGG